MTSRRFRALVALCASALALGVMPPAAHAQSAERTARVAGPSRIHTAVAISQHGFARGAGRVFLSRADVVADALAAGALTAGPVLLVPSCGSVPAVVAREIARLEPERVTALGGGDAVCDELLAEAGAGRRTDRIAGPSRFDTAAAMSRVQFADRAEEVYLAQAAESPDAVAAGVLTAGPILLVPSTGAVPASVREEITRLRPDRVVALGGVAAISDQMLRDVADGRTTHRIAGSSRVETAVAVSSYEYSGDQIAPSPHARWADVAHLARADVFADAVAAGSLARGPILLVPSCGQLPAAVRAELRRLGVGQVVALGGREAVCDDLLAQAGAALRG